MAYPQIQEKYGSLSYTGFAKEVTFGTPVSAATFLPMSSNNMEQDPGWFSPHLMQNLRDYQVYNLQGEAKFSGTVVGPLFPENAIEVLSASIGADAIVGWGVAAPALTPTETTTSTAATTAGATTITLTSGTGFTAGQQIVVDTGFNQEFRKIASVATNTVTFSDALNLPHATGIAVTTGTTTTLSAASAASATTITVTSATGIVVGTVIQIDVNSVSGTTTSEIRSVTGVASTTLTLSTALVYAHASSAQINIVNSVGPYTHTINEQNSLPSLTVEKAIGGYDSLQFAGCRVGKFDIKMPTGNAAAEVNIDFSGQSALVLDSPTPLSITQDIPFVFAEASLSIFGNARPETSNVTVTIDNGLKETYTYSGHHGPSFITPVILHVNGSVDVVFDSLDDATYGDYTKMSNQTLGTFQFALVHPNSAGSIIFNLPQVVYSKYGNDLKMEDVVMSTMTYEASRPLVGNTQWTLQVTVVNDVFLAY